MDSNTQQPSAQPAASSSISEQNYQQIPVLPPMKWVKLIAILIFTLALIGIGAFLYLSKINHSTKNNLTSVTPVIPSPAPHLPTNSPKPLLSLPLNQILMMDYPDSSSSGYSLSLISPNGTLIKNLIQNFDALRIDPSIFIPSPKRDYIALFQKVPNLGNQDNSELDVYSLATGNKTKISSAYSFYTSLGADYGPGIWSPDGNEIAFLQGNAQNQYLWVANKDGSNLHQLTTDGGILGSIAWSPDAKYIFFRKGIAGESAPMLYSLATNSYFNMTNNQGGGKSINFQDGIPVTTNFKSIGQTVVESDTSFRTPNLWLDGYHLMFITSSGEPSDQDSMGIYSYSIGGDQSAKLLYKGIIDNNFLVFLSPDKSKAVVTDYKDASESIDNLETELVNLADGTSQPFKAEIREGNQEGRWSDDGKLFVYAGLDGLYVYNSSENSVKQLVDTKWTFNSQGTTHTVLDNILISPDDKQVIYVDTAETYPGEDSGPPENEKEKAGVWSINVDGSNPKMILKEGTPIIWL